MPVPGAGVLKGVPRYYDEILREQNPKLYDEIKAVRRLYLKEHSDELTYKRLMDKHICKKARVKEAKRNL